MSQIGAKALNAPGTTEPRRLLDVLRETAQRNGHSERTIGDFADWVISFGSSRKCVC
jgi:hypothetical protein